MYKFGFNFLQLYFSVPRTRERVKLYRAKWIEQKKDITNSIFLNLN